MDERALQALEHLLAWALRAGMDPTHAHEDAETVRAELRR